MNPENTPVFELESSPSVKSILGLNLKSLLLNIPLLFAMLGASGLAILFVIAARYNSSRSIQRLIGNMDASAYIPNFLLATLVVFVLALVLTIVIPVIDIYLLKSRKEKIVINNDSIVYPTFGGNRKYTYKAFTNIHVAGNSIILPLKIRNTLTATAVVIYDLPEDKKQEVYDFLTTKIKRKTLKFNIAG